MKDNKKAQQQKEHPVQKPKEETPASRYRTLVISYLGILARIEKRSIQSTPKPLLDSLDVSLLRDKMHGTTVNVKVPKDLGNEEIRQRISELEAFLARNQTHIPIQSGSKRSRRSLSNLWPKQRKIIEARMIAARELLVENAMDVPVIEESSP